MYRDVEAGLAVTEQLTQQLFDAVKQSKADQAKLSKAGGDLNGQTNALLNKVEGGTDPGLIAQVMKLDSELSMVRVLSMRGQVLLEVDSKPALADAVSKAQATIGELEKSGPEDIRGQLGPLNSVLGDFHVTVNGLLDRVHLIHDLYAKKIAPQINDMQTKIVTLREQLQQNFGDLEARRRCLHCRHGTQSEDHRRTRAAVRRLIAFFIARSISNPIAALTKAMRELANGNFDVVLPGLARKDEIGNIAKAVDEFKVKAAEKAEREAEAKAEQDKRAEVERQAALVKMADEFQATVGGIVRGRGCRRLLQAGRARRHDRPRAQCRDLDQFAVRQCR